ncbi:MAG: hypothetical protein IT323_16370 [Anaerolineae bacterium]|nr:hypothetical protein [Anaerolineae bacterium]
MSRKSVFAIALFAFVLAGAGGVSTTQAATNDNVNCPPTYSEEYDVWVESGYCDGRLNAFDIDQPVAIYYAREAEQFVDDAGNPYTGDAIIGVEFWTIDSSGQGQLAMWVPVEDVEAAFGSATDVQIASQNGVTLSYSPSGDVLTATMGSYSFSWNIW